MLSLSICSSWLVVAGPTDRGEISRVIVVRRRIIRRNRRRVVYRRNFRKRGPRKRAFPSQMSCGFANITGNGSRTIASQMAGLFAVKANDSMTGVSKM